MRAKLRTSFAIGLLASVIVAAAIPWFAHEREAAARASCIEMLRRIDGAKQQWALEHNASSNAVPTWKDLYYYGGRGCGGWYEHYPPHCPSGGTYTIRRAADVPTCSFPGHVL